MYVLECKNKEYRVWTVWVSMSVCGVLLLLFATTRSVFKSVKISVVEIAKRTN